MRAHAKNILWVRTDSIGDAVLSASMLPHIRREYRDARITVVCQEHIGELYEACPYADDIVVFNRKRALLDDRYREEIVMRLRALKADVSLNSVYSREALTDWFATKCGAEQRIAFNGSLCNISAEIRDVHNQFYTDLLPSPGAHKLELERHKDFLRGLGIEAAYLQPTIWTRPEDEGFAERLFEDSELDPTRTIAMFTGAQHECRIYENYGAGISEFCKANRMQIIALGSKQDRDINQRNLDAAGVKGVNLSGRASILSSAEVLRRCRLAVGAETGLAHTCCAVGTPNVILLGGGHFGRFMPYSPLTSVVCLPLECYGCNWNCRYERPYCIKDIASEVVAEALWRSLEEPSGRIRMFMQGSTLWKAQAGRPEWKTFEQFLKADNIEVVPIEARGNAAPAGGAIMYPTKQEPECDVSIVLCTKDRAELLDRMLSSLEKAAVGVVYELIVVEGGSSDNTLDVLRRHNVWHVYNESQHLRPGRHSWPELYNFGFSKARGKWAMYASDDMVFSPNSVARAVEMLNRQKKEVAGGVFFYKNLHPTRQEWAEYGIDFTHGNKLLMNYGLVRLESFREIGGLDEAYNFYCADTDLCYKLYEGGRQLIPLGGCFVTHDNLLDVQKQGNANASGRDIELCQRRWRHFVPADMPSPKRLLWRDEFAEAFDVPSELEKIDSGIESFWRGLAYFGQGMFAEAEQEFIRAVQSRCDHRQVLWYLALAADKCQDNAIVEKAATGVVRLAPDFEPALELLLRVIGRQEHSPEPVLCSSGSVSADVVESHSGGYGLAAFHLDGQGWGGAEPAERAAPIATIRKMPRRSGPDHSEMELRREIGKFNKVVVWGLKTSEHTHAHIHRHFFDVLEKIGARAVFVDDSSRNAVAVESNDLVVAVDVAISQMPVTDGVYYCLHNCPDDIHRRIAPARNIRLQTYMSSAKQTGERWDEVTFFDSATRTLYQPWATDLLASEFKEPILHRSGSIVFWVGSIWDDALGRGNVNEIQMLKDVLEARGIRFVHLRGISDSLNVRYVRNSFIAPAIVGRWQVANNYLPCRMWKNISYGQLGVSNVRKFDDVFEDCTVKGRSIEELIDNTLSLPFSTYRDMICRQQEIVKSRHTYVNRLLSIIKAFESIQNC